MRREVSWSFSLNLQLCAIEPTELLFAVAGGCQRLAVLNASVFVVSYFTSLSNTSLFFSY
jgi:hypothetical protein